MDTCLAAVTNALTAQAAPAWSCQSVENAYYARHSGSPGIPAWMKELVALAAASHRSATASAPLALHA
jgi:hypothetical protein